MTVCLAAKSSLQNGAVFVCLVVFFDLIISSICFFFLRYWVLWLQVFNPRMTVTHLHLLKLLDSLLSKNLNYQKYEFISWKYWFEIWQKQRITTWTSKYVIEGLDWLLLSLWWLRQSLSKLSSSFLLLPFFKAIQNLFITL